MSESTRRRTLRVIGVPVFLMLAWLQVVSPSPLKAGVQPDPECEQACHDTYVTCYYDYCDQRGDCSYCWTDYQSCVSYCPQICVEPRSVRDWSSTTLVSDVEGPLPLVCLSNRNFYRKHTVTFRTDNYRDTTHCDGTVSRTLLSSFNSTKTCWKFALAGPCAPNPNQAPIEQQCILQ